MPLISADSPSLARAYARNRFRCQGGIAVLFWHCEGSISYLDDITGTPSASLQPRARGAARVSAQFKDGQSRIKDLRQSGAMKLLFPQGRPWLEAVMINSAGGITGGDRFAVEATAFSGAKLTVTTQAAERAYRAQPGETARMETRLAAEDGAALHWLPQETILYDACRYTRSLRADLAAGARFLMVEPLVFGRTGMGETLTKGLFHDRIDIRRDGQRLFYDSTRLQGDIAATLSGAAIGGGAAAMASLLLVAPDAETHLAPLRAALPDTGGATLLHPDVLYMRLLAEDSFEMRKTLLPILDRLTGDGLPLAWRL